VSIPQSISASFGVGAFMLFDNDRKLTIGDLPTQVM